MNAEELVKLMDSYMSKGGSFIKPSVDENGQHNLFLAQDSVKASDLDSKFAEVVEEHQLFTANVSGGCVTCADVPNILKVDPEDER